MLIKAVLCPSGHISFDISCNMVSIGSTADYMVMISWLPTEINAVAPRVPSDGLFIATDHNT